MKFLKIITVRVSKLRKLPLSESSFPIKIEIKTCQYQFFCWIRDLLQFGRHLFFHPQMQKIFGTSQYLNDWESQGGTSHFPLPTSNFKI